MVNLGIVYVCFANMGYVFPAHVEVLLGPEMNPTNIDLRMPIGKTCYVERRFDFRVNCTQISSCTHRYGIFTDKFDIPNLSLGSPLLERCFMLGL